MSALSPHERHLRRLLAVGRSLVSEFDLEVVLQRVLEAARELTGARYAALGVLDEERRQLERFLTLGVDDETRAAIGDLPRGRGVLGILISEPRPLRLANVGSHAQSFGFPPGHPPMSSFLGVPILVRGEAYGNLYLTEKAGGEFDEQDEEAAVVLAEWASIAIANARAYEAVEGRRDELERAVTTLEATTEIARALAGETDLQRVLELVVKRGRAVSEASSALVLLARDSHELEIAALAGEVDERLLGERIADEGTVAGQVLRSGRAERLPDVQGRLHFALGQWMGARSGLFVPLLFRGRALGVMALFDRTRGGPEFSRWDEHVMTSFATSAAAAVATALDVAQQGLRRSIAAAEQERRRWARELHDETLQELAALKLQLRTLQAADAAKLDDALRQAGERVDHTIASLRRLITDLRPAALDDFGLGPALAALAERVGRNGVHVEVAMDLDFEAGRSPVRFAPELEDTVYRVVQEALANVVKHAVATSAAVTVRERDGAIEASVRDDGAGFDPAEPSSGFGMLGMRERAALVGGTIAVDAEPGRGTTVRLTAPARRVAAEAAA